MATVYWLGTAAAVAQVDTVTPANVEIGDVFSLLVGGVTVVSFTATGASVANVTAGLTAAWNASTHVYCTGITAADATTHMDLTADVAGVPFTVTSSTTDGGGNNTQTLTVAVETASAGPNDWSTAANWSGAAIPANTNDVIIKDNSVNICWGLDQNGVTLNSLRIDKSYTGKIGLNRTVFAQSADGATTTSSAKVEYRDTYLKICATTVDLGQHFGTGSPTGSGRIMLDTHTTKSTITVYDTAATASETGRDAVRLKMNKDTSEVYVRSAPGGVGIAVDTPAETSSLALVSVSDTTTGSKVHIGPGTTVVTWKQQGGDNLLNAGATVTTVTVNGGELLTDGTAAVTTVNVNGGTMVSNSTGTITTLNLNGGTVDFQQSNAARTVTTLNLNSNAGKGGTLKADGSVLTVTTLADASGRYTIQVS